MQSPNGWNWLNGGLVALFLGLFLLDRGELFLLLLWGTGLTVIGVALSVVGAGLLLRMWR
ncbi:MAG: hypothetical protein ACRDJW_09560 [Thermomicrobiales bacterium]